MNWTRKKIAAAVLAAAFAAAGGMAGVIGMYHGPAPAAHTSAMYHGPGPDMDHG